MAIEEIKTVFLAEQSKLNKKQDKKGDGKKKPQAKPTKRKKKGSGGRKAKEAAKMKALNRYDKKTWKNLSADPETLRKNAAEGKKRPAIQWTPNGLVPSDKPTKIRK